MNTVLVVEDEPAIRNLERATLKSAGYRVLTASNGAEALKVLESDEPEILVLDLQMPVMDGWTLLGMLSRMGCRPRTVIVSAVAAREVQREFGAEAALPKPFLPEELLALVEAVATRAPPEATQGEKRPPTARH